MASANRCHRLAHGRLTLVGEPLGVGDVPSDATAGGDATAAWPIGRTAESARLVTCLDRAVAGTGDATVLRGEIGIGVSTLLDALGGAAVDAGVVVARARGRTAEQQIDGAALRELAAAAPLRPLLEMVRHGELAVDGPNRRQDEAPLTLALADVLTAVTTPMLVIVDDAHLVDQLSLRALFFAGHRVAGCPLALVFGGRSTQWGVDDGGLERLDIGGLDTAAVRQLVGELGSVPVPFDVANTLREQTGGNPLAVHEVVRRLRPSQLQGIDVLPAHVSPGGSIGEVFAAPLRALDAPARRAVSVAAAEPTGDLRTISLALDVLGDDVAGLEAAEEAGVVTIADGRVRFDHPLRRAAGYHLLAAPSRRAAHRALAVACDRPGDGRRRVEHLDIATLGPDESVATDIEHVARSAEQSGDRAAAARWWARAASLSPAAPAAQRRQAEADRLRSGPEDPLRLLTPAERRVADAVGSGLANKEAAAALHVSVKTVDAHLQAIYRKLTIRSRTELALLVSRLATEPSPLGAEATA